MEHKKKFPRLPELDGLRGLAALAVFAEHFLKVQVPGNGSPGMTPILRAVTRAGYFGFLGVDVFFCLSGFLITSLLLVDRDETSYFHNFYWKRVLRIVPVYGVHLIVSAILFPHARGYILLSSIFLVNFASRFGVRVVGPTWSLSIEEQFYLLWPHVIRRMRLETIYYVAFGLIAVSTIARIIVPLWHGAINIQYTFYRCDGLALGAVLSCQWFSKEGRIKLVRFVLAFLNSNITLIFVLIGEGTLLFRFSNSIVFVQLNLSAASYLTYRMMRFILNHRTRGRNPFSWLGSPVAVYFGAISYALYLYQSFVILEVDWHFGSVPVSHTTSFLMRGVLDLALCVGVATVSRFAMELPIQRLRRFVVRPSKPMERGWPR